MYSSLCMSAFCMCKSLFNNADFYQGVFNSHVEQGSRDETTRLSYFSEPGPKRERGGGWMGTERGEE